MKGSNFIIGYLRCVAGRRTNDCGSTLLQLILIGSINARMNKGRMSLVDKHKMTYFHGKYGFMVLAPTINPHPFTTRHDTFQTSISARIHYRHQLAAHCLLCRERWAEEEWRQFFDWMCRAAVIHDAAATRNWLSR